MSIRKAALALAAAAAILAPAAAWAIPGKVTASVNMRTGPGVGYSRITTIPAQSAIEIVSCPSWCLTRYDGFQGWVAKRYVRILHYGTGGEPDTWRPIGDPGPGRSTRPDRPSGVLTPATPSGSGGANIQLELN